MCLNSKIHDLLIEDEAIEIRSLADKTKPDNQVLGLRKVNLKGNAEIKKIIERLEDRLKNPRFRKWKQNGFLVFQGALTNKVKVGNNSTFTMIVCPNLNDVKEDPILDQDFSSFVDTLKDLQM